MQPFSIKCYHPGARVAPSSFFILSRGRNSGRPSSSPNPNCYVFTCAPQDLHFYYWLIYGLWDARYFERYLHGSCVEFMYIDDLRNIIADTARNSADSLAGTIAALQKLLSLETKAKRQLEQVQHVRRALLAERLVRS